MVENIENLPEKSTESNKTALTAQDVDRSDIENYATISQEMTPGADKTLLSFDGQNEGLELTGTEDFNLHLKESKPMTPADSKSNENGRDGNLESSEGSNNPFFVGNLGILGTIPFSDRGTTATKNEDGLIEKLDFSDTHSKSSYEFSADGITRTLITNSEREVTKFDEDGNPASAKLFTLDNPDGKDVPVDDNDYISVTVEDGNTMISLNDSGIQTEISITPDGKVQSKTVYDDATKETTYNDDGTIKSDSTTNYGENGFKQSRKIETAQGITNESYDDHGNWEKSETTGDDFTQTKTREDDGSIYTLTNKTDGSRFFSLEKLDGSSYHGQSIEGTNLLKTVNTDGSSTIATESKDASTYLISDKDGNWVMYNRNKNSGIITMTHGDKVGPYKSFEKYTDT